VAVLTGAGGCFCAGADLKALARAFAGGDPAIANPLDADLTKDGPMGPTRLLLSKPVIAAVSGYAVGGGFELALWCDLRIAERDVVFGAVDRRFGVPLIDGGTWRLPRLVGMGRALDLILTGRPVGAEEALAIGEALKLEFALGLRVIESGETAQGATSFAGGGGRHGGEAPWS